MNPRGPVTHDEFGETITRALAVLDTKLATSDDLVMRGDHDYLSDALEASRRLTIDAETVADALAIAAEYC